MILPDGTAATLSGAVAFAKDKADKPYRLQRNILVEASAAKALAAAPTMADAETIVFKVDGQDYRLKRFHVLKWTYAADGRRLDADWTKVIEPDVFIYELTYRQNDLPRTDYVVKCAA